MAEENHATGVTDTGLRLAYDFVPERSDYVAVLRAMPTMRAVTVLSWLVLAVVLTLAVLMSYFLVDRDGEPVADRTDLMILLVLGVPAALILLGYSRLGGHAAWRKPANREPVRAVLDADGFSHAGPSGSQSFRWPIASRARETTEAYYVYVPNGLFSLVYWLPKRAVPVDEQVLVRAQIQAHVGRYKLR
ncbi:YcxB family protein [Promicromonospora soli]|uniref:YcxB-like C-terminal domain-containing protein n=1 Tax=Promicromonospora soli TaxID=2035533 RepID=A0A919FJ97_9MICO|nr:YcxB family protein [Promicromonospora soli]GHH66541.1 hypothetical protein GCM10017772_06650 [Promicromonospora soli]